MYSGNDLVLFRVWRIQQQEQQSVFPDQRGMGAWSGDLHPCAERKSGQQSRPDFPEGIHNGRNVRIYLRIPLRKVFRRDILGLFGASVFSGALCEPAVLLFLGFGRPGMVQKGLSADPEDPDGEDQKEQQSPDAVVCSVYAGHHTDVRGSAVPDE